MIERIRVFDFPNEIDKKNYKKVLSTISTSKWKYITQLKVQRGGVEIIPSFLVILSRLKNLSYKAGTKITLSRLSYKQPRNALPQPENRVYWSNRNKFFWGYKLVMLSKQELLEDQGRKHE